MADNRQKVGITDLWTIRYLRSIHPRTLVRVVGADCGICKLTGLLSCLEDTPVEDTSDKAYEYVRTKLASKDPGINFEDTPEDYIDTILKRMEEYFTNSDLVELTEPSSHLGWKKFAQHMGLDKVQQQVFVLAAAIHDVLGRRWNNNLVHYHSGGVDPITNMNYRKVEAVSPIDFRGPYTRILLYSSSLISWLSFMLNIDKDVLTCSLFPKSKPYFPPEQEYKNTKLSLLVKLGIEENALYVVADVHNILVPNLSLEALRAISSLHLETGSKKKLAHFFAKPIRKTKLTEEDFDYVQFDHVVDYLQGALDSRTQGVNVLIYGPPGTGKSEFVRMLSKHLDAGFVEVPTDDNTTSLEIGKRLGKIKTAELLLKQTRGVLVVDEAEDIFSNTTHSSFLSGHSPEHHSKHLLNEFLETTQTPIIWIVNNRYLIDPAFRRRCDAIIKIDKLPSKARRKIIQKHTHGLTVPASWKDELAKNQALTPADIGSAARMAKLSGHKKSKAVQTMERALSSRLEERAGKQLKKSSGLKTKIPYRIGWLNTDADMYLVLEHLSAGADARFCFYGAPGTGKTAFARHAAEQAGLPLVERRASDLLSKWVGESEQNIAWAFQEAKLEGAILLIDEVDSFLQSRSGANHSWEVSMVNELLTQMEEFGGTLICCTNLMDGVDEAAFRRFDVKIQFRPLTYEQAAGMLGEMGVKVDEVSAHQLRKIPLLTPGDFAAVQRRFQFLSKGPTAQTILAELQKEVAYKKDGRKKIGF